MRPPYRGSHGSPRDAATALMRSASGWAAWCFQSLTQACGSARSVGTSHSGTPVSVVGSIVHEVKSIPIPTTSSGVALALRSTSGTVAWIVAM